MQIADMDVRTLGKRLGQEFGDDDVSGLAAELSYHFFLALLPFVIFLAALGGLIASASGIDNPADRFVDNFGSALPADAASVVRKQVDEVVNGQNAGLLSLGIIGTLWASAGGMSALMKAMNRAYDIPETRPFWKKTALSLVLTIAGGVAIVLSFAVMVATSVAGQDIADAIGAGRAFEVTMAIARFPIAGLIIILAVGFVYWAAPNSGLGFKWVTPGALFFTVAWLILTTLFAFYVANFSSYNATYGALGGVVVLLVWFNLTSMTLLMGAELNALVDEARAGELLRERRELLRREAEKRSKKRPAEVRALEHNGADDASVLGSGDGGEPAGAVQQPPSGRSRGMRGQRRVS